jgi:hypothetical protein
VSWRFSLCVFAFPPFGTAFGMSAPALRSTHARGAAPGTSTTSKAAGLSAGGAPAAAAAAASSAASSSASLTLSANMELLDGDELDGGGASSTSAASGEKNVADVPTPTESELDAAATAAAARYRQEQIALLKAENKSYDKIHSSSQVLLLLPNELWDTMALDWCQPRKQKIRSIVNSWDPPDLAACVYHLGLPVLHKRAGYLKAMRQSVVDAVRAYAEAHPGLFEDSEFVSGDDADNEEVPPHPVKKLAHTVSTPPRASLASAPPKERRSPRALVSSRSAAAAAAAALSQELAPGPGAALRVHAPRRGASTVPGAASSVAPFPFASPPPSDLNAQGGGESSSSPSSSDEDEDYVDERSVGDGQNPYSFGSGGSLHRGGRLRTEELSHQLAAAGVQRPLHEGFLKGAQIAAAGRSMYQLYVDVTSTFSPENRHSKRECLALARILDALLRKDLFAALEHTCRRLGGVQTAVDTGNWAMCDRLETETEQRTFVPDEFMRSALKSVTQMQAVKQSAAFNRYGGSGKNDKKATGGSDAAGGKGRRPWTKLQKKDGSTANQEKQESGASSSSTKKGGSASS